MFKFAFNRSIRLVLVIIKHLAVSRRGISMGWIINNWVHFDAMNDVHSNKKSIFLNRNLASFSLQYIQIQ